MPLSTPYFSILITPPSPTHKESERLLSIANKIIAESSMKNKCLKIHVRYLQKALEEGNLETIDMRTAVLKSFMTDHGLLKDVLTPRATQPAKKHSL